MSKECPKFGAIVGCYYPDNDLIPVRPGKKFRPCIVLGIFSTITGDIFLILGYGTGQSQTTLIGKPKTKTCIEIEPNKQLNNLDIITKFDLSKFTIIPFIPEFFQNKQSTIVTPFYCFAKLTTSEHNNAISIIENNKINLLGQGLTTLNIIK